MKIGLIREGKFPVDRRVALTPSQCRNVKQKYKDIEIVVQKSPLRCFKDSEYKDAGFELVDDVSDCDILLGIKEVPIDELEPQKTYLFFSHTIKKQAYNRDLLISVLNKKIRLIDYETLTNSGGQRIIAFGRFAGLVGAYNAIRTYGLKHSLFELKPAHKCFDMEEMEQEFKKAKLPPIKIVLTGGGRVAHGAMEILDGMGISKVKTDEFISQEFDKPVYAQLEMDDYHYHKDGKPFELAEFFKHPQNFNSSFEKFLPIADMIIAGAYWDPNAPVLFTREDAQKEEFKIKVIADITCDIEGSIPSTKRASSIDDPFYDYDPFEDQLVTPFSSSKNISVMAVDNLPNELPRNASIAFGEQLIENVLDSLIIEDKHEIIKRATIAEEGRLTPDYRYLEDFVNQ